MPKLSKLHFLDEMEATLILDAEKGVEVWPRSSGNPPEDAITVRFRPRYYDRQHEAEYDAAIARGDIATAAIERVIKMVTHWDLEDEQGAVIALEAAALEPIPTRLLNEIISGCVVAMRPNAGRSNA